MRILDLNHTQSQVRGRLGAIGFERTKELLGILRWKRKEMAWPLDRLLAFFILFQASGNPCLKSFWVAFSQIPPAEGQAPLPSYNTICKWFARSHALLAELVAGTLSPMVQGLGYINSMKLPICEPYRWVKSMGKAAGKGHGACQDHWGFKLHALIDSKGNLCAACVSAANVHDLKPVKDGLLRGQTGTIYADKGYVSRDVHYDLMRKNLFFCAKPRDNMGLDTQWSYDYVQNWRLRHAKPYRKRVSVERFFAALLCRQWIRLGVLAPVRVF